MKSIDLHDLLPKDQFEQITDICLDTMADNHIFPEIWELHIKVTVDQ